jgi:tetratricopeptide (TPR) repeat protein
MAAGAARMRGRLASLESPTSISKGSCVTMRGLFAVAAAVFSAAAWAQSMPTAVPVDPTAKTVPAEPTAADEVARLLRERKPEDAIKRADAELAKNPRNAQVRFMRAVALTDLKRTAEAIAAFEALNAEFPELPEPYNNLAVLLAADGKYEPARVLLLRSLDAQPGYTTALENLGDLYIAMAADAYQRANARNPNDRVVQAKLALARDTGSKLRAIK